MEGRHVYHNHDFYAQDNWRATKKLTLDVGIRITHNGPQYDSREQSSNFFPNRWSASSAPYLYTPGCSITVPSGMACPSTDLVAVNPLTGASQGAGSSAIIGDIVPNSGNVLDGIVQAGHGIAKTNYTEPFLWPEPRLGVTYGATEKMVIRGGFGLFTDRPQGDAIFGQIGNPPTASESTVYNSTLQQVAAGTASAYQAPLHLLSITTTHRSRLHLNTTSAYKGCCHGIPRLTYRGWEPKTTTASRTAPSGHRAGSSPWT